ncbi:glycosyltransferase family 2 protein [Candidatus Parcubacteria bacterium]|nr:MAG: glycosyltransferase family 2 protein [Candidatus Parcubacteria bacterium]
MYRDKSIAVVVPAYNEERLITRVIETMPDFVDWIVVVDDNSKDQTSQVVETLQQEPAWKHRLYLIRHERNRGVGGAISSGYKWAKGKEADIAVVMAGDAQMAPDDLPALLDPIVDDHADYTKGNRLITGDAWKLIPHWRYLGNAALSLLTKIASGYWHVADSQCGYTAISKRALNTIDLDNIYPRYGMPNHLLIQLNIFNMRVRDVPVKPVYGIGEQSGIRPFPLIFTLSWRLLNWFLWRIKEKYVIRDFHPLVFFYALASMLLFLCLPLSARLIYFLFCFGNIPKVNALALMFCSIAGLQSLFFAMWFDMESNKDLK